MIFGRTANTDGTGYTVKSYGYYTYDAWGNVTAHTYDNKTPATTSLIYRNPLRYRGYYYDTETGFYYLQSRYYDPANHRFINADVFASTDIGSALASNMFAYCKNQPVNYYDSFGAKCEPATPEDEGRMQEFMEHYEIMTGEEYIIPVEGGTYSVSISHEYHEQRQSLLAPIGLSFSLSTILSSSNSAISAVLSSPGGMAVSLFFALAATIDSESKGTIPSGNYTVYRIKYTRIADVELIRRNGTRYPAKYELTYSYTYYCTDRQIVEQYYYRSGREVRNEFS